MKLNIRLIMLTAFLLSACAKPGGIMGGSDAPQWINSEPDMYPNFSYLTATGSGADAEQAKARALSNLAKIFEVQIREVSTTKQNVQTSTKDGVETVQTGQSLDSTVNLSTDKMVKGARVAEQWINAADVTYHALAVLDRKQAGNNIRGEMNRLDEETGYVMNQQSSRNDTLLKISDLHQANQLQQDRKTLQQTLKIIDVKGSGAPARWNLAELNEQLQQALRSLPLQTVVKEDDTGGLNNILQGAASAAGFVIGDSGYQLAGSLTTQQPIEQDNWYWLRGTLKVEMIAEDGLTVLGYQTWPLKVSSGDYSLLQSRLLDAADKKLKQELLSNILEFTK